jgi:hypothetical protein
MGWMPVSRGCFQRNPGNNSIQHTGGVSQSGCAGYHSIGQARQDQDAVGQEREQGRVSDPTDGQHGKNKK